MNRTTSSLKPGGIYFILDHQANPGMSERDIAKFHRIEKSQGEIGRILPARPQYVVSTSEFDDVKSRLASIENRHKVLDDKEGSKPSLRRASTSDKSGKDDKSDDDRPTLKRRDDTKQN